MSSQPEQIKNNIFSFKKIRDSTIFENDSLIVLNKPAGLLSIPDRQQTQKSLKDILQNKYGKIFVVHRLDKDTSGVIVFAKNETTHKYLSQLFEERKIQKFYLGFVFGIPSAPKGIIDIPIIEHPTQKGKMTTSKKGKSSITDYEVVESYSKFSLVKFQIHTGRTHQIRIHAKHIGHPIVCDELYGDGKPIFLSSIKKKFKLGKEEEEKPMLDRLVLHSHQIVFNDLNGTELNFIAELPKDMRALMQQLKKISR